MPFFDLSEKVNVNILWIGLLKKFFKFIEFVWNPAQYFSFYTEG